MRFTARVFLRIFSFLLTLIITLSIFSPLAHAQVNQQQAPVNQYAMPNVEPDVPQNQHTFMQSMFIETLLAIGCQLTGIDLANPGKSCLGINLDTGKLGYAPPEPAGNTPRFGGALGMLNGAIGTMYTPTFGSGDYVRYLAGNFGIVKSSYAAPASGFEGLSPILGLWKSMRDVAYYLLIVAFIFISIGVIMRVHIDPRTVMTVQNQIPRIIICVILITFSYAFAALMIDTMWAVTYMGINKLTESNDFVARECNNQKRYLSGWATENILSTPFSFANRIFLSDDCDFSENGLFDLGARISAAMTDIEIDLLGDFLAGGRDAKCEGAGMPGPIDFIKSLPPFGFFTASDQVQCRMANFSISIFRWFMDIALFLIAVIIIIVTLFRIWFELLKAYVMVLIDVIFAPLWFVFGLLPKKPMGFEKWLRGYFANLAVFPATVFILVLARVFHEAFNAHSETIFVPPLVGNPLSNNFGALIEFGMLLMAPTLTSIIREKIGSQPLKQSAAILQGVNIGRTAVGGLTGKVWQGLNRRNPQTLGAEGVLAKASDLASAGIKKKLFSREGIFGAGPDKKEGFIRQVLREDYERTQARAHGQPYYPPGPSTGTGTQPQPVSPRSIPANHADASRVDAIMGKNPNSRTLDDERLLERRQDLLTPAQVQQRDRERQELELYINMGGRRTAVRLSGNPAPAQQIVISNIADPQERTQVADEIRAAASRPGGDYWNSSLDDLSPLQKSLVQDFIDRHPSIAPPTP